MNFISNQRNLLGGPEPVDSFICSIFFCIPYENFDELASPFGFVINYL
ncbi:hypothetical protein BH23THE1_BH23THE1_36260 [soil metagenome]